MITAGTQADLYWHHHRTRLRTCPIRLANIICVWSWILCGINPAIYAHLGGHALVSFRRQLLFCCFFCSSRFLPINVICRLWFIVICAVGSGPLFSSPSQSVPHCLDRQTYFDWRTRIKTHAVIEDCFFTYIQHAFTSFDRGLFGYLDFWKWSSKCWWFLIEAPAEWRVVVCALRYGGCPNSTY